MSIRFHIISSLDIHSHTVVSQQRVFFCYHHDTTNSHGSLKHLKSLIDVLSQVVTLRWLEQPTASFTSSCILTTSPPTRGHSISRTSGGRNTSRIYSW
jgi:hypothetical protein